MRALVWITGVLALLYGGYWFVGRSQVETRARAALADLEAQGWEVDYSSLETVGFPSRFDTTVTDLALASPDGQVAWEVPVLRVYALSYRPNHVIARLPPTQRVTVGGRAFDVAAEGLQASARAGLSADLPFRDVTVESGPLTITGPGIEGGVSRLLAAVRLAEAEGDDPAYLVFLEGEDLAVAGTPALDLVRIDALATLGAPIDRRLQEAPPLVSLSLRDVRLARASSALTATGTLMPDAEGFLAGEVVLAAEDWRGALLSLEEAGLLTADVAGLVAGALEPLAEGDRIDVPVTFAEGRVSALGLPLLAAPQVPQRQ